MSYCAKVTVASFRAGRPGLGTILIAGMLLCFVPAAAADPGRTAATPSQAVYGQPGQGGGVLSELEARGDERGDLGGEEAPVSLGETIASPGSGGEGDGGELPFTGFAAALVLGGGLALVLLGGLVRAAGGRLRRG